MSIPVVVTGIGPISAIGCGRDAFWDSLIAGRHGFGPITQCDVSDIACKIGAEVSNFDLGDYLEGGKLMGRRTPRPVQFGLAAGVLALHDAEIDLDACDPDRFGVHVGTSLGNSEETFRLRDVWQQKGTIPAHAAFHCFNHSAACVISSIFNISGPIYTTSQGCNSGVDALGQSMRMIQAGSADAMLVIGTDCELVHEVMASLGASNSLATRYNDNPGEGSRPFDKGRDGNVIGEGAGALLLESEQHAQARKARVYARVAGYMIASSGQRAYSADKPDIDTRPMVRAMRGAIKEAGWQPSDVDLINANGSSSVLYDKIEGLALQEVFGDALPNIRLHSIKSMLGQHGAGSSALQAVAACLSIRRAYAPPTINHTDPDPECGPLRVVTEPEHSFPQRVLMHSIGLGGFYSSCAVFQSPAEFDLLTSGKFTVQWSEGEHRKFKPTAQFREALRPWTPDGAEE